MIGNMQSQRIDPLRIEGGIPVKIDLDNEQRGTLWVRPASERNPQFLQAREAARAESPQKDGESDLAYAQRLYPWILAHGCIRDWDGFLDDAGRNLDYTPERGLWLLDNHVSALAQVVEASGDAERYRLDADTKSDP